MAVQEALAVAHTTGAHLGVGQGDKSAEVGYKVRGLLDMRLERVCQQSRRAPLSAVVEGVDRREARLLQVKELLRVLIDRLGVADAHHDATAGAVAPHSDVVELHTRSRQAGGAAVKGAPRLIIDPSVRGLRRDVIGDAARIDGDDARIERDGAWIECGRALQ